MKQYDTYKDSGIAWIGEIPSEWVVKKARYLFSIATYLDKKTSQIDSLIALKQEKIEELKDYKKSIIYEYVTGKKRV